MPNPQHLARYPLADLFLDSMPYGAHTTAADSLWMNVPILTLPGRSFASRVCTSLIRAAGIGELECSSADDYVARAVELGQNREKLAAIKAKLAVSRDTCLLFDTPKLVGHLEDLYRQMWSDFKNGALPAPDLDNLDIYHDIGIELEIENTETLTDDAYAALYREQAFGMAQRLSDQAGHENVAGDAARGADACRAEGGGLGGGGSLAGGLGFEPRKTESEVCCDTISPSPSRPTELRAGQRVRLL